MKRAGVDPSEIGSVALTHLHGDHFGGLPFLILDGQFSRRERPLTIAGPPGVRTRVEVAMEVLFPGSSGASRPFPIEFVEFSDREPAAVGSATVTPSTVRHASGSLPFALRVEYDERVIAYSGDTEWTDDLLDVARGADLFICEAYFFQKDVKYHLSYQTLRRHIADLECRRVILTHMSQDMLDRADEIDVEMARDGQTVVL
jgi:ribonuclease BN (tRNA processing enzyme)